MKKTRICSRCKCNLFSDKFYKSSSYCKKCLKEYYAKNKERFHDRKVAYYKSKHYKEIRKRERIRNRKKILESKKKWYIVNRKKLLEKSKVYRIENIEMFKKREKKYRKENREMLIKKKKKYYQKNREKLLKKWKEYSHELYQQRKEYYREYAERNKEKINKRQRRYMATPQKRLNHNITGAIYCSLKGIKNGRHWESLVDYKLSDLKKHLEKQFRTGMSWENYGKIWVIDHIVPKSVFNFKRPEDIDFKRCWKLENLRPLFTRENLTKWAKLDKPFQPMLRLNI